MPTPEPRADRPSRPAVFLDRDDTLIACRVVVPDGDLGDPELVRLMPGALDACQRLREGGFTLVVVTNQGGVARGKYTEDDVEGVHQRINALLGGLVDAFRFCPFHPQGTVARYAREHPWRKPAPGMLIDAAKDLGLDLTRSWVVGDGIRDCQAGRAAGCRTILVSSGRAVEQSSVVDFVAGDLSDAASIILRERTAGAHAADTMA